MCNRKAFYQNWDQAQMSKFRKHRKHRAKQFWKEKLQQSFAHPPVNVLEEDDKFVLHVYAPGLNKSDFLIATIDNTLSISVENKPEETNWKRQEFAQQNFKRQFELSDKVDKEAIKASYENGVLIVTLPKLEGAETSRQEIEVL